MYYPKSQITSNLYTNGGEFVLKNSQQEYVGYYWKTISNTFHTGKTPQDSDTQQLDLISTLSSTSTEYSNLTSEAFDVPSKIYLFSNIQITADYNSINKKFIDIKTSPTYSPNIPTQKDYDAGEFTRYFCKKTNEIIYLEINKDTYTKLVNKDPTYLFQLYQPFKFQWVITGDKEKVYIVNKNITRYMIEKFSFPFLNKYLKDDYLKYYK